MNFPFAVIATLAVAISGNGGDGAGFEPQVSRSSASEKLEPFADQSGGSGPTRSMLRNGGPPPDVITEKESHRDESTPLLEPTPIDKDERMLAKCDGDESSFKIDLTTDNYGFETSWTLEALEGGKWTQIESGPPGAFNYAKNTRYLGVYCLRQGDYRFTIRDMYKDGMCCSFGEGHYAGYLDGSKQFSSPSGESKWALRRHRFEVSFPNKPTDKPTSLPTRTPTQKPTRKPSQRPTTKPSLPGKPKISACNGSQRKAKIEILTDKWGKDTSWKVTKAGSIVAESTREYGSHEKDELEVCLDEGATYDLIVRDEHSDGMCCSYGGGYYKVYLKEEDGSWDEIISGGNIRTKETKHSINLQEQTMTDRDGDWLNSHNSRRKEWHERYNKTYVPLKWSNALKEDSSVWAEHLLERCGKGLYHDPDTNFGENLAGNSGSGTWGEIKSTEAVLTRFVEREESKTYPANGHLTQVLWRSTKFVGCVDVSKPKPGGGTCHVQVCRYARPGNCNMNKYKSGGTDEWWLKPMLMDYSPCGTICPPDGCY
ncbi:hypothetical protein ACHAWF_010523 [Thalassiosira exigua]